ncbi:Endopeptidase, NLPC/P60 domain containing protein [Acidimicrobiia bacterium]
MDCGASPQRRGPILAEEFGDSSAAGCARGAAKGAKVSVVKRSRSLRLGFVSLSAAVVLLLGAVVVGPASADPLSDKKAEAARIGEQLAQLQDRQQELNGQYEQANYELQQAQEKVNAAKVLAAQTAAEADVRREDLRQYAVAAYQSGNDSPEFDALISNDASTGVQKRSYLQSLSGSRQDLVDALNAARQKAEEDGFRLKAAEDVSTAKAAEIEQLKKAADDATNQQAALNARVQGELRVLVQAENARIAAAAAAARAAAAASSSGGRATAAPNPNPGQVRPEAARAIAAGRTKLGAGYVWAAEGPDVFDCSGFVRWAFLQVGISLQHYSGAMYKSTIRISESQLQPGDLVFWGAGGSQHVAIYIGGNQILHTAKGVAITSMNGWWTYGPIMSFGRIP